jgi:hypothetical protein
MSLGASTWMGLIQLMWINVREYRRGNRQSTETDNTVYTRRRKTKQKHNTICVEHHYTPTNKNNVNKTCTILQITGGKDKPNIVFMRKS